MNGNNCCKVFAFDADHKILIEERICPGITLRYEQNVEIRVPHFLKVFSSIHRTISSTEIFPTYLDWLNKAEIFSVNHNVNNTITDQMHIARLIGEEMFCKYPDRVLLHGDLHHDNMLLKDQMEFFMIDPKGVIGPEIFDLSRFILNEMDFSPVYEQKQHVLKIVDMVAKSLNYPPQDIIKLFFVEVMLANVWFIEEGKELNLHKILIATELMNEQS